MSSADSIAKVVSDLRNDRIEWADDKAEYLRGTWHIVFNEFELPVIDATKVFGQMNEQRIDAYEDHLLFPVWNDALVCYVNRFGNVNVLLVMVSEEHETMWTRAEYQSDADDHVIEWKRVKWLYNITLWIGGWSETNHRHMPTRGPVHAWVIPVYEDGTIADIRWIHIMEDVDKDIWTNSLFVALQTYNFMNCVNVEIAEPHRDRMERKRIRRLLGETEVTEIRVRPISKTRTGEHYDHRDFLVPLHAVRGHFARYGPEYGRKLLFGKYAGRFWIQPHVRGTESLGTREHKYNIEPEQEAQ
jgi:hypothetical protein